MRHPQASKVVNKDIISHFVLRLVYCKTNLLLARKLGTQRHFSTIPVRSPFRIGLRHDVRRVLSSHRLTCSSMFTFIPTMRTVTSFMVIWWKRALLFSKKQHRNFP